MMALPGSEGADDYALAGTERMSAMEDTAGYDAGAKL